VIGIYLDQPAQALVRCAARRASVKPCPGLRRGSLSSSELNLAERFFRNLTGEVIHTGGFTSLNDSTRSITAQRVEVLEANCEPGHWR
jgi:hypothetical protein